MNRSKNALEAAAAKTSTARKRTETEVLSCIAESIKDKFLIKDYV